MQTEFYSKIITTETSKFEILVPKMTDHIIYTLLRNL